jgi:hypothetical protein
MTALTIIDTDGKERQVLHPITNNILQLLLPGERLRVGSLDAMKARGTCMACAGYGLKIDDSICGQCNGSGRSNA